MSYILFTALSTCVALLQQITAQPGGKEGPIGTKCEINGRSASYTETINGDLRNIISTGCPNHNNECIGKSGICEIGDGMTEATELDKNINIPLYPCISDHSGDGYPIACVLDSLGIMLNGVSIFGPAANMECDDAVANEGSTFNYCGGHATPNGIFHYHVAPSCLLQQLNDASTDTETHSPQIGWAFDGFPMYGPHGSNGEYIDLCTNANSNQSDCLDTCNGHSQHIMDGFTYHYHISGPVGDLQTQPLYPIADTNRYPYTIGCFRGVPYDWSILKIDTVPNINCLSNGTTNDYVATAMNGVTELYGAPAGNSNLATNQYEYINIILIMFCIIPYAF